jgi:hypothetical protein
MNGVDDNGKPINMSIDKNGFVLNGDKVSMNMSGDQDTYAEDAKPIEGLKNYNRDGQLMTIVSQKGVIQNFNTKGELTSIFRPNGVVKSYQNKKLTSIVDNGKKSNFNYSYSTNNKTNKKGNDPYNTLHLKADNGFTYVNFTLNGVNIWKCYRNENALGDLKLIKNKPYFDGHEATSEELKRLGLLWYNNSLNPLTGGFQIITNDVNGSNHSDDEDEYDEKCDNCLENLKDNLSELEGNLSGLLSAGNKQKELKELANQLKELQKKVGKKGIDRSAIRGFDDEFRNLKTDFIEFKNNCNCGENKSFSYSNGTDEQVRLNAEKMAEQARKNAKLSAEQSRRNSEQLRRDMEQSRRDMEQSRLDSEQAKRDSEQAKRDATSGVAKDNLFRSLVNEGFIKLNEKCTIRFHNDQLKVNGKNLDEATFNRFKAAFEKKLGKKTNYFIKFSGVVTSVSENGVNMTGTFTNSISNDD